MAPRVLIANSLLVPEWATWEEFWRLESMGLTAYGQMTAGSWIYIGTQGILQGTFQTFAAVADQRFGGTLAGRLVLTAGLGGMGGAQPLAVTMNGGVALCVEVDPRRRGAAAARTAISTRRRRSLEDALGRCAAAVAGRRPLSVGVVANAADAFPDLLHRDAPVDVVTDQTSAHDPLYGYVPADLTLEAAAALRASEPGEYVRRAASSMARHCSAMVGFLRRGAEVFDYGNNLRGEARLGGFEDAFAYPGLRPGLPAPAVLRGQGAVSLGRALGRPGRHRRRPTARCSPLSRTIRCSSVGFLSPGPGSRFQGLPARICWLGYGERDTAGAIFNDLVSAGRWLHRSSSGGTTSTPAPWHLPTGRPRPWPTAPTPSPTGRS